MRGAFAALELLTASPRLTALLLNVGHLGDTGAVQIAEALGANRTLEELGVASNGVGPRGGAALAEAVASHPALPAVDLGYSPSTRALGAPANTLGDGGAAVWAEALARDPALEHLDLRRNGVGAAGRAALAEALTSNRRMRRLLLDLPDDPQITALLRRNRAALPHAPWPPPDVAHIRSVYRTSMPSAYTGDG